MFTFERPFFVDHFLFVFLLLLSVFLFILFFLLYFIVFVDVKYCIVARAIAAPNWHIEISQNGGLCGTVTLFCAAFPPYLCSIFHCVCIAIQPCPVFLFSTSAANFNRFFWKFIRHLFCQFIVWFTVVRIHDVAWKAIQHIHTINSLRNCLFHTPLKTNVHDNNVWRTTAKQKMIGWC